MGERRGRLSGFVAAGVILVGAGCGADGDDDETAGSAPGTATTTTITSTSASTSSMVVVTIPVTELSSSRVEGLVVARGQTMVAPHPWWWVVDRADGSTIEGSGRVLVEVPQEEVGCGEADHPIGAFQIEAGEAVSFELVDGAPGDRPEFWFPPEGETFASEPAVRGRRFRVACPAGTENAATELSVQRAIWDRVAPENYEFSMSWYVFNDTYGDYRIAVVDGEPVSILREDGIRFNPARLEGDLPRTIDELFDSLEGQVSADSFVATYDPELGYPSSVIVDEMLNADDDELEVRVHSLRAGASQPPAGSEGQIGQRIEANPVDWYSESPDGVTLWLLVDAGGGVTVAGSSRLAVQIPIDEIRCGPELRPIQTLGSLDGGAVSFELTGTGTGPPPNETPMWTAGPAVTARQLHLPTC